jgi:hypothetical protein
MKILHLICNGKIKLRKLDYQALENSKRLKKLRNLFEEKLALVKILNSEREMKVQALKQFSALYRHLLYTMFNEI